MVELGTEAEPESRTPTLMPNRKPTQTPIRMPNQHLILNRVSVSASAAASVCCYGLVVASYPVHPPLPILTRNGFVQSSGSSIRLSEAILTVGVKIGGPCSPIEGVSEDPLNSYVALGAFAGFRSFAPSPGSSGFLM